MALYCTGMKGKVFGCVFRQRFLVQVEPGLRGGSWGKAKAQSEKVYLDTTSNINQRRRLIR